MQASLIGAAALAVAMALVAPHVDAQDASGPKLGVELSPVTRYQGTGGDIFEARYGKLSDGSLHFVKLKMPDGRTYTLPQVLSGSGSRYTDEREIVWWTHQGTVRIDVRDSNGEWQLRHQGLREVPRGR